MPVAHAVVQAVITATPTATPIPTPSPTVQAATHAAAQVVQTHSSLVDTINALAATVTQPEIIAAGAAIAVAIQGLINKLPWLQHEVAWVQDVRRRFVSVVIPVAGTALVSFTSGHNDLHLAPALFLVGQVVVWTWKAFRSSWKAAVTAQAARVVPAPADTAAPVEGEG